MFSNHNGVKLEINNRKKMWETHKYVRSKQHTQITNKSKKKKGKEKILRDE